MQVETLKVGILQENTYILSIDDKVIVIDPGDEFDKINKVINKYTSFWRVYLEIGVTDFIGGIIGKVSKYTSF